LKATATLLDFNLAEKFTREAPVDVPPDAVRRVFDIPTLTGLTPTYFVRLALHDRDGRLVSRNFYWLSTQEDQLDWGKTQWYTTPTKRHANLTALSRLPATTLSVTGTSESPASGNQTDVAKLRVTVANTGPALAFQVHLKVIDAANGAELLPALWEDNYFELLPGERREIGVSYPRGQRGAPPRVTAEAWNTTDK
jgi:exo-1,4-beta-D-glucosaminidase